MEGSECIVCFKSYDDHKRRPRIMPCGHTVCSVCLGRIIIEESKMCPTCREVFTADNVKEFKVNYALENSQKVKEDKQSDGEDYPLATGHRVLENTKTENLLECAEHELPLIHRCSTHKAWVCQKCIKRDHSSESCKMITISEELNIKKELQLSHSQPILKKFDEACKMSGDCRKQLKQVREECISKRSQEYIQRTETLKNQMEKNYALFDKKLGILEGQRSIYEKSVDYLKSSNTIKGVARHLDEVQNETENLQLISEKIEKEVQLMLEEIKESPESTIEHSFSNQTLEDDLSDLQTKYQVLHQEKEQSLEESRQKIASLEETIKKNKESSVSSVWLWLAAFIFAGLALAYGFSVSNMQSEKNLLEKKPHQLEDHLLSEKCMKIYIMSEKNLLEERLHQLEDNLLSEKEMNKDIMSEKNLLEERLHQLEDNLLSEKEMNKDIMSENNLLEQRLHQLEDNLLSEKVMKKDIMSEKNLLEEKLHQLEDHLLSEKEMNKDIMSEKILLEKRLHQLEDHLLREKQKTKYITPLEDDLSDLQTKYQVLHQEKEQCLEESRQTIAYLEASIKNNKETSVSSAVWLWSAAIIFAGLAFGYRVSYMQSEKNLLEQRLQELEDDLLKEKEMKKDIVFRYENSQVQTDGIITFMDFIWPNQVRRRVHMKMIGNTSRVRQHLLWCTGLLGHSYIGLSFYTLYSAYKRIIDAYAGKRAAPLIEDVTVTDGARRRIKAGFVADAGYGADLNMGLFGVYLKDNPRVQARTVFAEVISGLDILQDIAISERRQDIRVVECGISSQ